MTSNFQNIDINSLNGSSRLVLGEGYQNMSNASSAIDRILGPNLSSSEERMRQIAADLLNVNSADPRASIKSAPRSPRNSLASNPEQNAHYLSSVEAAILRSTVPIDVNETEEITVLGQRGIWANKAEVNSWRGALPISEYKINEDNNPEIITKVTQQNLTYIQELAVRYLRPPTPPPPGEIVITQETNSLTPPAPPLIIRQQPPRPSTPEPIVIREAPPQAPPAVGRKVITISGKRLPPPPRKVIIERLAPLPSKPQSVIVERWLPYSQVKRRVIFQKTNDRDPVVVKPKNVIVQWEAPQVTIKKDFKYLGVIRANPVEYVQRYGPTLKTTKELPDFVLEIKPPQGIVLAADYQYNVHELEGEVQALGLVDLDREGLSEYKDQLRKLGINYGGNNVSNNVDSFPNSSRLDNSALSERERILNTGINSVYSTSGNYRNNLSIISEIFSQIELEGISRLTLDDAEKLFNRLNSRLGRRFSNQEMLNFFNSLNSNRNGAVDLREFKVAFERYL